MEDAAGAGGAAVEAGVAAVEVGEGEDVDGVVVAMAAIGAGATGLPRAPAKEYSDVTPYRRPVSVLSTT